MNTETIIPNDKGLASVSVVLKSQSMVEFKVSHWRDLGNGSDYNYEYSVHNKLTDYSTSFHEYYDGGDIESNGKKEYEEQVKRNEKLIERVKEYLAKK